MKRYITFSACCLLLSATVFSVIGCADVVDQEDVFGKPIRLSAGRSFDFTRAATDIQSAVFDANEEVNVFIKGTSATVATPTAIGDYPTVFTTVAAQDGRNQLLPPTDATPHYLEGNNSNITVTACYPKAVTHETTSFTVKDDQTSDADYKASDLMMVAPINHAKNNEVINLPFEHKMAKLIISAIGDPGVTMDGTITLGSTTGAGNGAGIYRTIGISVENGDFATPLNYQTNAGLSNQGAIVMTNGGAVLIPPQTVTTADFIIVTGHTTADPTTRECRFAITNKTFEAGKTYKLTLAIGPDNFNTPETITGWSTDYGELTLMPSGGYQGVSIDAMPTVTYDGTYHTPTPDVWYGTTEKIKLKEGRDKDFIYNYVDNKNAGNAQVLVIGQNYYAGLAAVQGFTIKKAPAKIFFPEGTVRDGDDHTGIEFEVNKSIDAIKVINTGDGAVTYTAENESGGATNVVSVDPIEGSLVVENIGECYIRATTPPGMITGQNYYYTDGSEETTVNNTDLYKVIVKAKPATKDNFTVTYNTGNTIHIDSQTKDPDQYFVYNGKDQQLVALTVSDGQHVLARDIDYEAVLTNSKNVGNATLTVTGKKNYNATFTVDIPVCQATPTITVDETELTMGIHQNTAPMNRRKTRRATTEEWASAKLSYTSSDPTVATISERGLITGLKAGTTTITVNVAADDSGKANWAAAVAKTYTVNVVTSDYDFQLRTGSGDPNYTAVTSGVTNNTTQRVTYTGAHAVWTCPASGIWQLDCWGAQGASTPETWPNGPAAGSFNRGMGGRGAHIAGRVYLKKGQVLHVVVGEQGKNLLPGLSRTTGANVGEKYIMDGYAWNGGANVLWGVGTWGGHSHLNNGDVITYPISGGGGATDMSLDFGTYAGGPKLMGINGRSITYNANTPIPELAWKSPQHLYSRVIVAGGGGGALYYASTSEAGYGDGGDGGAYVGQDGLFNDHGAGGQMTHGGAGGYNYRWESSVQTNTMTHALAKSYYPEGPYAGGWSCSDGMFGEGGYYTCIGEGNGCGGGGWYGGGAAGQGGPNGTGGGGSSFMWTSSLATYYTTASPLKTNATVISWGDANFFDAPATKYPSYVPSSLTSSANYFPYMEEVIKDTGARAGDGKAMITAVELDDECVSK